MHCIQESHKIRFERNKVVFLTAFIFPYFHQSSVQYLKVCLSYTGV